MKNKLLAVLVAMYCDHDFYEHIEKEFHIFHSYVEDIYDNSTGEWDEIVDQIVEEAKPYIKIVYEELQNFY